MSAADERNHQVIAILRRIRGLSVPVGSDYGHGEIAELSKEALGLLEAAGKPDEDEVFRLRRLTENQAAALDHWRRLSDQDAARIRELERRAAEGDNDYADMRRFQSDVIRLTQVVTLLKAEVAKRSRAVLVDGDGSPVPTENLPISTSENSEKP